MGGGDLGGCSYGSGIPSAYRIRAHTYPTAWAMLAGLRYGWHRWQRIQSASRYSGLPAHAMLSRSSLSSFPRRITRHRFPAEKKLRECNGLSGMGHTGRPLPRRRLRPKGHEGTRSKGIPAKVQPRPSKRAFFSASLAAFTAASPCDASPSAGIRWHGVARAGIR